MGCSREPGVGSYWRQLVVGSWGFQSDFWVYELGARRKPTLPRFPEWDSPAL